MPPWLQARRELAVLERVSLLLLRGFALLLTLLPRSISMTLGAGIGGVLARLGWRRALVESNLLLAYPGAAPEERHHRERIACGFYVHFGRLLLEIVMMFSRRWDSWAREHVVLHGLENWEEAHAQGRGVIVVSSHLGNWEAMAAGVMLSGADGLIVTKHLKPEWIHREMERNRLRTGVKGTYEPTTLRDVLAHLKKGGTVGFVIDQYAGPPIGIRVPFFGVPVGTLSAPAIVAGRTGAVVLAASCTRDEHGRLHVSFSKPFEGHSGNSPREIASRLALWVEEIEKSVRKSPQQWLWSHRRFKGDLSPLKPGEWDQPRERPPASHRG
jgi:KDO2-lipid IV(A) lauroyltransferase